MFEKYKLEDAFFKVELVSVCVADQKLVESNQSSQSSTRPDSSPIQGVKAIRNSLNGHVYSFVRNNYRLITNEEAYKLGRTCFKQVFGRETADMVFYNLIMPKTGSCCHMDFFARDENVYLGGEADNRREEWKAFLRISNSYNKMSALKFDIGFCRSICKNGCIFGKNSIAFKYYHNRSSESIEADFELKYGKMNVVKQIFQRKIERLHSRALKEQNFMRMISRVFPFTPPKDDRERKQEKARNDYFAELISKYCKENGNNAYALFNVLTDYASRPRYAKALSRKDVDMLERRVGIWMMQYVR